MKSYEMLKDEPAYQTWLSRDPEINPPPGGESGEQMTRRVLAAYKALESRKENTVIVTHGGVIAAIARQCPKPIRFIGIGERVDDLRPFVVRDFVDALFD